MEIVPTEFLVWWYTRWINEVWASTEVVQDLTCAG